MLNTNLLPARQLQKAYKSIIEGVKTSNQVVILTTNNTPQAALISLADLDKIQQIKAKQANLDLLKLAIDNQGQLKDLPANLRERADEIVYTKNG